MSERIDKDACHHRYISPERKCQTCGMRFERVWSEGPVASWQPLVRVLLFAGAGLMLAGYSVGSGGGLLAAFFVALTVFFLTRAIMAFAERFIPRAFRVGRLDHIGPRRVLSLLSHKPLVAHVAGVRFQLDARAAELLRPGDLLLVEFLRWTRLPVILYRGR